MCVHVHAASDTQIVSGEHVGQQSHNVNTRSKTVER
jgi:hypothetical protein